MIVKKVRDILTTIIITFFIALGFSLHPTDAVGAVPSASQTDGTACGYNEISDGKVPVGVAKCNVKNFKFNSDYYYGNWTTGHGVVGARNLIVYGDVNSIPDNRFKKGSQSDPNNAATVNLSDGYFYSYQNKYGASVYGEYEYMGYSADGVPYHNIYFINDANGGLANADKHWIFKPWYAWSLGNHPSDQGLVYRSSAGFQEDPNNSKFDLLSENISNSLGFPISQGVDYDLDKWSVLPSTRDNNDPRNFMRIDQPPTTREAGFGTMWHFHWGMAKAYYQTFPLNKLTNKTPDEILLPAAKVLDGEPIPLPVQKTVTVNYEVSGVLDDAANIGFLQGQILHFTRNDIKYWCLGIRDELHGGYKNRCSNLNADGVVIDGNSASVSIPLEIDQANINKPSSGNWYYTTSASVQVVYWNGSSKLGFVNVTAKFKDGYGKILSKFNVRPNATVSDRNDFTADSIKYKDTSIGDIGTYEIKITSDKGGSATYTYHESVQSLSDSAVSADLIGFVKSRFPATAPTTTKDKQTFTIVQKVIDKDDPSITDVSQQTFVATLMPKDIPQVLPPEKGGGLNPDYPAPPHFLNIEGYIPDRWYDIVPFPARDDTKPFHEVEGGGSDGTIVSRSCAVDGVDIDTEKFWSGQYVFGDNADGLHQIHCKWISDDGSESIWIKWTVIYDTKPHVASKFTGLYKQNRTMIADNISPSTNDPFVSNAYPITYTYTFTSLDDSSLRVRTNTNMQKVFMYKTPGRYRISLHAVNTLGRVSDPYDVDFTIQPDETPAIIATAYNSQVSRLDKVGLHYDVQSIDGDQIASKSMKVYYDDANNNTFTTLVGTYTGDLTSLPPMSKVGQYKFVVDAAETTTQDRLMEFITAADDKTKTATSYFFVDNYAPSSDLYLDTPNLKPNVDLFFMLDKNMTQTSTDFIRGNKITIANWMTQRNMIPAVDIWDMKTYTFPQAGSQSIFTGSTYPAASINYCSPGGYCGTLPRTSLTNEPYQQDDGYNATRTESQSFSDSCTNSNPSSDSCPGSMSVNSNGYSGSIDRSGTSCSTATRPTYGMISESYTEEETYTYQDYSDYWVGPGANDYERRYYDVTGTRTVTKTRQVWGQNGTETYNTSCTAYYSGTLSKQVTYWVPNWQWHDSYTGHYNGTLYKDIRQSYDSSFQRVESEKYIVYVADASISELADLQYVASKNAAKVILVGGSGMSSQITNEKFILNNKPMDQLVTDVLDYIALSNPAIPKAFTLIGDTVNMYTATADFESDTLQNSTDQLLVYQNPTYFDNSMGYDTVNGSLLTNSKATSAWKSYVGSFVPSKPGKYTLLRRIMDLPSTDPKFSSYARYSNESTIEVIAHRRPIGDVSLDWDYDLASNTYITRWVDKSYDLDHNVTRAATDRGIVLRKLRFTNTATGEVFTSIPANLAAGTYTLNYTVKDIEGAWSIPIDRTYTLVAAPPIQFTSNLNTVDSNFNLNSVPASEQLRAFDLWTRYPYSVYLTLQLPPGGGYINQTVPYYSGTKNGNDINWNNVNMTIPATTPDGNYVFRIMAIGAANGSTATNDYNVTVITPINLTAQIDNTVDTNVSTIVATYPLTLRATTTKYPSTTTVTMFKGTAYQTTMALTSTTTSTTGFGNKNWSAGYTPGAGIPAGSYVFEWTSTTPNGNVQRVSKTITYTHNTPPFGDFKIYTYDSNNTSMPIFEGDTVHIDPVGVGDNQHDTLSVNYNVTDPTGAVVLNSNYTWNYVYPTSGGPTLVPSMVGTYTVIQTLSDGKAAPVTTTHTFNVNALGIAGTVSHTTQWEANRVSYNTANPTKLRSPSTFWAGERFILASSVTNTGSSLDKANSVTVTLLENGVSANLTNTSGLNWSGFMWQNDFDALADGTYNFRFSVTYSNGVVKTTTVPVLIKDDIWDEAKTHRKQ